MFLYKTILLILLSFLITLSEAHSQTPENRLTRWRTDGIVNAMYNDGNKLYVGGSFTYVGPERPYLGKISLSTAASDTSFPVTNGIIYSVISDGSGGYYIGGDFTTVGIVQYGGMFDPNHPVTEYNKSNLAHITSSGAVDASFSCNTDGPVLSLLLSGGYLYVGGSFTTINGVSRNNLAKIGLPSAGVNVWNPAPNGAVRSLSLYSSTVYAGGSFTTFDGQTRNRAAAFNNASGILSASWNPDVNNTVNTISATAGGIYIGGSFTSVAGTARNRAAMITSTGTLSTWDPNASSTVYDILVNGSTIYLGGTFVTLGGSTRNGLGAVNTSGSLLTTWNPLPPTGSQIRKLLMNGTKVIVAGKYSSISGAFPNYLAAFDATTGAVDTWQPAIGGAIFTMVLNGSDIVFGGDLQSSGGLRRRNIAEIDPLTGRATSWVPQFPNSAVNAITKLNTDIIIGGNFTSIGGTTRNYLAALNQSTATLTSWNPNPNGSILSLANNSTTIYAGGNFTSIGATSTARNYIAGINSAGNVTTFNPNANAVVRTININGTSLFFGGDFTTVNGVVKNYVAKVSASTGVLQTWDANISTGTGNGIYSLYSNNTALYLGGTFTTIGGASRLNLASVSVSSGSLNTWTCNANNRVRCFAYHQNSDRLFVGGDFSLLGGAPRAGIAGIKGVDGSLIAWNPAYSSSLGVYSLSTAGDVVCVGGYVDVGNGVANQYLVSYYPTYTKINTNPELCPENTISFPVGYSGLLSPLSDSYKVKLYNSSGTFLDVIGSGSFAGTTSTSGNCYSVLNSVGSGGECGSFLGNTNVSMYLPAGYTGAGYKIAVEFYTGGGASLYVDGAASSGITVSTPVTPSVILYQSSASICQGTTVTYTASADNAGTNPTYSFYLDGSLVQTGPSNTYTTSSLSVTPGGQTPHQVYCVLNANNSCQTTPTAQSLTLTTNVLSNNPPTVTLSNPSTGGLVCSTSLPLSLNATYTGVGLASNYAFYENDILVQSGASTTYTVSSLSTTSAKNYKCTVTIIGNACYSSVTSSTVSLTKTMPVIPHVTLNVDESLSNYILLSGGDIGICEGSYVTFYAEQVNGGNNPLYNFTGYYTSSNVAQVLYDTGSTFSAPYTVFMLSNYFCLTNNTASATRVIRNIRPEPYHFTLNASESVCEGNNVNTNLDTHPSFYLQDFQVEYRVDGNVVVTTTNDLAGSIPVPAGTHLITATITGTSHCGDAWTYTTNADTVRVYPVVQTYVTVTPSQLPPIWCQGSEISYDVTIHGLGPILNSNTGSGSYILNNSVDIGVDVIDSYTYSDPFTGDNIIVSNPGFEIQSSQTTSDSTITITALPSSTSLSFPCSGGISCSRLVNTGLYAAGSTYAATVRVNTMLCSSSPDTSFRFGWSGTVSGPTVTPISNQTVAAGYNSTATFFSGSPNSTFSWSRTLNSSVDIGMPASGNASVPAFLAYNNTTSNKSAQVFVTGTYNRLAYIPNFTSNNVTVRNLVNDQTIATIPVGVGPTAVAVSPDQSKVYVVNTTSKTVSIINTSTQTVTNTLTVGPSPRNIVVRKSDGRVFVSNNGLNTISVINGNTVTLSAITGPTGCKPRGMALSDDGTKLFVVNQGNSTLSVYNASTYALLSTTPTVTAPYEVEVDVFGMAYVNGSSKIGVHSNLGGFALTSNYTISTGSRDMCLNPTNNLLYLSNTTLGRVLVFNRTNGSQLASIPVGSLPIGLSINDQGTLLYVANSGSNTVSVVNTQTNTVVGSFTTGSGPNAYGQFLVGNGCPGPKIDYSITVTPPATPYVTLVSSPPFGRYCSNDSISFIASSLNSGVGPTYVFRVNGTIVQSGPNPVYRTTGLSSGQLVDCSVQSSVSYAPVTSATSNAIPVVAYGSPDVNPIDNQLVCADQPSNAVLFASTYTSENEYLLSNGAPAAQSTGLVSVVNTPATDASTTYTVTARNSGLAIIPMFNSNTIQAVNTATGVVVASASTGLQPFGIAVHPSLSYVYVTSFGTDNVQMYDANNALLNNGGFETLSPRGIALSADGQRVFVANSLSSGTVSVFNSGVNQVGLNWNFNQIATIPVGSYPRGMCISADGSKLFVVNQSSNSVSIINTQTLSVIGTVAVGTNPWACVVTPDNSKVFVTNSGSNSVSVIDVNSLSVTTTIPVGSSPRGIAINRSGSIIYVSNYSANSIQKINPATLTASTAVAAGTNPLGLDFNGTNDRIYVCNYTSNNLTVHNANTGALINTIALTGNNPTGFGTFINGSGCYSSPEQFNITTVDGNPDQNVRLYSLLNNNLCTTSYGTPTGGTFESGPSTQFNFCNDDTAKFIAELWRNDWSFGPDLNLDTVGLVVKFYVNNVLKQTSTPDNNYSTATFVYPHLQYNDEVICKVSGIRRCSGSAYTSNSATSYLSRWLNKSDLNTTLPEMNNYNTEYTGGYFNGITPPANGANTDFVWSHDQGALYTPSSGTGAIPSLTMTQPGVINYSATVIGREVFYIPNYVSSSATVKVVNAHDGAVRASIPVGGYPYAVAVSPDESRVYVSCFTTGTVSVINTASNTVISTITVGSSPRALLLNPAGTYLYASNFGSNSVSVINTSSNTVVATVPLGTGAGPRGMTLSPDGSLLYVSKQSSGGLAVVNTTTNTVVSNFTTGLNPWNVLCSEINPISTGYTYPSGWSYFIYVVNGGSNSVTVIDPITGSTVATLTTGSAPRSITEANGMLLITNYNSNSVSYLGGGISVVAGGTVALPTVSVGTNPISISVQKRRNVNEIYVYNYTSKNINRLLVNTNNATVSSVATYAGGFTSFALGDFVVGSGCRVQNRTFSVTLPPTPYFMQNNQNEDRRIGSDFDVIVYPNPYADSFSFQLSSDGNEPVHYRIFDLSGRLIESGHYEGGVSVHSDQLGQNLAAGIYSLEVSQGNNKRVMKVIHTRN